MPGPPADAGVAWSVWQRRGASFATVRRPVWASLGVGAAVWFGRWRAGPFGGDNRVELGPQQVLVGAEQLKELLVRAACRCRAVGMRIWGITLTPGLRR